MAATDKRTRILSPTQRIFGEEFNLPVFIGIVRGNLIWLFVFILIMLTGVFLYLRYTYPVYRVSTKLIYRQNDASQALDFLGRPIGGSGFNNLQVLKSSIILQPVLEEVPLRVSYFERGRSNLLSTEYYSNPPFKVTVQPKANECYNIPINFQYLSPTTYRMSYVLGSTFTYEDISFGQLVSTPHFDLIATAVPSTISDEDRPFLEREFFFRINSDQYLINWIAARLTATTYNQGGQILQIDMEDHLPTRANHILNTINSVYIDYDVKRQQRGAENVLSFIAQQLDTIEQELSIYENSLKAFKLDKKLTDPQSITNYVLENLNELEQEKVKIMLQNQALDWLEDYVRTNQPLAALSPELIELEYKGYTPYLTQIETLEAELENLRLSLQEDHLRIRYVKEQLATVKDNLYLNLDNVRKRLLVQETYIDQELGKANSEFEGLSAIESEFLTLSRVRNNIEKFYLSLLDKQTEYQIRKASIVENFAVLTAANNGVLVAPKQAILRYGAIGVGIFLWIVLIVLRYVLLNRIQTLQEIEDNTQVAVLGSVPSFKHKQITEELMVYAYPKSVITEAFRNLRSNLEFISRTPDAKLMAITSTVSGEGKTFIAVNLAGVLAMAGKKVVLLDLDMRRPKQHRIFGLENLKGMSTVLIGKHTLAECTHSIEDGFDFIPSGPLPPNPSELILSEAMRNCIADLQQQYDFVICDTPPIGMVSDALELIKKADYPIYVLRNDYSKREFINFPNKLYHESNVHQLSIVLNDTSLNKSGYGYGRYGYGYGYAYGGTYGGGYYTKEGTVRPKWWQRLLGR